MRTIFMIRILGMAAIGCIPAFLHGQESLSLERCQQMAVKNAPRLQDRDVLQQIGQLKTEQSTASWFPSLNLNARISYQSDVVELALEGAPFAIETPEVPHDQYGVNLDVQQNLYDGGMTSGRKAYQQALTAAELQEVEVDLYGLKVKVSAYYFPLLVLQENRKNLALHMRNLDARFTALQAAVQAGAALESELAVIRVEQLKIRQQLLELEAGKRALLDALGVLCGLEIPDNTYLELPELELSEAMHLNRPEYRLFELKHASMEAGKKLAQSQRMPVLYAYGQTGYGKPGYNMLSAEWDLYYLVGAGIRWKIWDWNSVRKDKEILTHQQQLIKNQRASFDQQIQALLLEEASRIDQYKQSIQMEAEVLNLQQEITSAAASALQHGTLTASEYILELNKESMSRIRLETLNIQLLQAQVKYLEIQGNL